MNGVAFKSDRQWWLYPREATFVELLTRHGADLV